MKLSQPITVGEIAQLVGAKAVIGDPALEVRHLNEINRIRRGSLIFVDNEQYYSQAIYSSASAVLIAQPSNIDCPPNKALIIVDNPFAVYNQLAMRYAPFRPMQVRISPSARIGKNTIIEYGVVIGDEVVVGDDCLIRANTVLCTGTEIGNNVIIHPNTTIGSDAFYFRKDPKTAVQERLHSIGRVVIEDCVEIGAGCTIDKGISTDTRIAYGTKIDNQVHIGHGVEIGKHCLIAAQVGIAGKTVIQDYVTIYGQAGISQKLVIGEGATILSKAGVSKSLLGGRSYFGIPATEARTYFKEIAALRSLPEYLRKKGFATQPDENDNDSL